MHPENRMADEHPVEDRPGTEETQDRPSTEDVLAATEGQDRDRDRAAPPATADDTVELFQPGEVDRFRMEWREIQARFVDDPRDAVKSADHLVAEVMRSLATTFTDHKHELEGHWQQGDRVETEDLRTALRHYRSFFNQLLSV